MLEYLKIQDTGPAPQLDIEFTQRLNFLVGDNGLGKSFLLDAAWWALTRTWARQMIRPHRPPSNPEIEYSYITKGGRPFVYNSKFSRDTETWGQKRGRPSIPGLVLYAQVDGGFSVWDPARNYWKDSERERLPAYLFAAEEVWDGLPKDQPKKFCNGLIADWANWQLEAGRTFDALKRVLNRLSPSENSLLEPGELTKVSLTDARRHPTIKMPYNQDVPLIFASAGVRRIVALAYLLVWTWQEHVASCELRGDEPTHEIIFLIDEIEAHLHPQWQRRIIPALLDVMSALTEQQNVPVQVIIATHSPIVMASVQSYFDTRQDSVWNLKLDGNEINLKRFSWMRYGDINAWLTSPLFDLAEPSSLEAERAIEKALAILRAEKPQLAEIRQVDQELRAALGELDSFWIRWSAFVELHEGQNDSR